MAAKYDQRCESPALCRSRHSTAEPYSARLILYSGEKKIQVRKMCTYAHTLQGLEDCSQVIAKLTSSNCSLKCLPPDWLKRLSNGSCNKPCHMLLGNKQKQNKTNFFFAFSCYRSRPDTLSQTHY